MLPCQRKCVLESNGVDLGQRVYPDVQSINQSIIINLIWRQLTMLTGSQYCSVRPNYNIIHWNWRWKGTACDKTLRLHCCSQQTYTHASLTVRCCMSFYSAVPRCFYRALCRTVLGISKMSVCHSVRPSVRPSVERVNCNMTKVTFAHILHHMIGHPSLPTRKVVSGRQPFVPEIWENRRRSFKNADF